MRLFQPFKIDVNLSDALILISSLDYLIADIERCEIDRAAAEKLRQRILNEAERGGVQIGD